MCFCSQSSFGVLRKGVQILVDVYVFEVIKLIAKVKCMENPEVPSAANFWLECRIYIKHAEGSNKYRAARYYSEDHLKTCLALVPCPNTDISLAQVRQDPTCDDRIPAAARAIPSVKVPLMTPCSISQFLKQCPV